MAVRDVPGQPVIGFFSFTPYRRPLPVDPSEPERSRDVVEVVKRGHARPIKPRRR